MAEQSLFSQTGLNLEPTQGASQAAFDFHITESQLNTQVDFSFLDWGQTQPDGAAASAFDDFGDLGLHGASQVCKHEQRNRTFPAACAAAAAAATVCVFISMK